MTRETKLKEEKVEVETPQEETPKGRTEEEYFFPHARITIRASSLKEAQKKLKELKK